MLPCAPWLWTPPPCSGGLQDYHLPHGSEPHLPTREGSGAATCPVALSWPRASGIKKGLAGLGMQLGSRVPKACSRITKAPSPDKHYKTCGQVAPLSPFRRANRQTQCNAGPIDHA
jgi:hypothetical protein